MTRWLGLFGNLSVNAGFELKLLFTACGAHRDPLAKGLAAASFLTFG